MGVHTILLR